MTTLANSSICPLLNVCTIQKCTHTLSVPAPQSRGRWRLEVCLQLVPAHRCTNLHVVKRQCQPPHTELPHMEESLNWTFASDLITKFSLWNLQSSIRITHRDPGTIQAIWLPWWKRVLVRKPNMLLNVKSQTEIWNAAVHVITWENALCCLSACSGWKCWHAEDLLIILLHQRGRNKPPCANFRCLCTDKEIISPSL